jgi:hypothetical protein
MSADRRTYGIAALVLLLVSVIPIAITVVMWLPDRELAAGPRASAEIIEVLSIRTASKGPPDTSHLRIRFVSLDGQAVTTTVRTTRRQFDDTVEITYDRDEPTRVRAVDGPEQPWRVPAIVVACLDGLGIWFGWTVVRLRIGRPSRLYRRVVWQQVGSRT